MQWANIIEAASKKAEQAIPINEGDYIKDGRYFCGKCHTAKECIVRNPFTGKMDKHRCLCACEEQAYKDKQEQENERQRRYRAFQMRSAGLHDRSLANKTFANDNGINPNMQIAEKYVARWEEMKKQNVCAIFSGDCGCGKTYAAACIANALIDRGVPVLMTTASRIIDKAMSFNADYDFVKEMREYDLLILDDFGAERTTEYATQKLFDVIDARINQGKPMILTTNLRKEDFAHPKDLTYQRIFSRLTGGCVTIPFKGGDLRAKAGEEKKREAMKLFL